MGRRTIVRLALYLSCGLALTAIVAHGVSDATVSPVTFVASTPQLQPWTEASLPHRAQFGVASWYGYDHQGRLTASGKPFDARKMTAAHPTLPLNSKVKVTNLDNGKTVEVTITDRGPGIPGRAIDLSLRAAQQLGMKKDGLALVMIVPLSPTRTALE
jgi:rare lipoprotein A